MNTKNNILSNNSAWWLLLPIAVFLIHTAILGLNWIIDDAGISFAYARNLSNGCGLVSQPTVNPVEGFSNPLWVFILTPFFTLNSFHLLWTPKIISVLFVMCAFLIVHKSMSSVATWGSRAAIIALTLTSMRTGFVVWCVSGLENPLTVLLATILMTQGIKFLNNDNPSQQATWIASITSASLALTRPDGILYVLFFPFCVLLYASRKRSLLGTVRPLLIFIVTSFLPLLAYLTFRYYYFGKLLPNTYYAKGGASIEQIKALLMLHSNMIKKILDLMGAFIHKWLSGWLLIIFFIVLSNVIIKKKYNAIITVYGIGAIISATIYLLLPYDWMDGYRFATSFLLFFYIILISGYECLAEGSPTLQKTHRYVVLFFCIYTLCLSSTQTLRFKAHPPIPVSEVLDTSKRFEDYSHMLDIKSPSILIADIGGFLYRNNIRVYDLGMLCDKTIAESLGEGSNVTDLNRFHNYLFDTIKPTFIATRAYHSWIAKLDQDPRFRESYTPIFQYTDQWILNRYKETIFSGDFIRNDVIIGKENILKEIKDKAKEAPYAGYKK